MVLVSLGVAEGGQVEKVRGEGGTLMEIHMNTSQFLRFFGFFFLISLKMFLSAPISLSPLALASVPMS